MPPFVLGRINLIGLIISGARVRQFRGPGGADVIRRTRNERLRAPFGLGSFDQNTASMRMNPACRLDAEAALKFFIEPDAWALHYIQTHAERFLKC